MNERKGIFSDCIYPRAQVYRLTPGFSYLIGNIDIGTSQTAGAVRSKEQLVTINAYSRVKIIKLIVVER